MPYIQFIGTATVALVCPLPLILDTFTAVDGTDPTTRDLDTFPAITGTSRWRSLGDPASIESGVLTGTGFVELVLYGDASEVLVPAFPYFLLCIGNPGDNGLTIYLRSDGNDDVRLSLDPGGVVSGYVVGAGGADWTVNAGDLAAIGSGSQRVGVFVTETEASLIGGGAVLASSGGSVGSTLAMNYLRIDCGTSLPGAPGIVGALAVYAGITLAQALAVTDGTCFVDTDADLPPSGPASTLLLKFDSGLLVDQNSTRTNTLTSNGTPTAITTDPKWGTHCAEFDSTSNENIDVASPSDFKAASGEATIDFWFKPSTAGSNTNQGSLMRNALFTTATSVPIQQYPVDNTHLWWWWNTANGGTFGLANSGQTVTGITSGVWHHFRACFYTDNTMNFYVDGTRVGTNLIAGSPAFDAVSIGNQVAAGLALDGAAGSFAWQGSIDSVRILTGTALEPSTATTMTVPTADFPTA